MRTRIRRLVPFVIGVLVLLGGAARLEAQNCSVSGQNRYVRDVLFEYYYWYRELPNVNPATFPSPEAYLDAVRHRPLDATYSYIANRAEQEAFFSSSQFIGLGFSTQFDGVEMRLAQVFPESPASDAGLARGDRVLEINGRTVGELFASGQLGSAFGPGEEGVEVALRWRRVDGEERSGRLVKRAVTIPTVSLTRLYEVDGRKVGYIVFRNFVEPSFAALDEAFTQLRAAGATELVLDLRYNGGGLVSVAQHLASLIGGSLTRDQLFAEFFHNDRHPELNKQLRFEQKPNALDLRRLVVIATRASASASELIVNALRPFMPVVLVGDRTFGKPVGQYGFPFCDKIVNPVSFVLRNARGESDFFDGFAPDCQAADDLDHQFGDPQEASLSEAFAVVRTGACSPRATDVPGVRAVRRAIQPEGGWQQLLGAH